MRILVCGGRDYHDHLRFNEILNKFHKEVGVDMVIEGGAKGADMLAANWAYTNGVPRESYLADWENQGKFAGPMRNQRMLDEGLPDIVIAFPGGRGTADMCRKARKAGVEVYEVA